MKNYTIQEWIELPVPMDLSETSVNEAIKLITEYCLNKNLYANFEFKKLRLPSQLIGQGFYLTAFIDASIELSTTYNPDEWSLEKTFWIDDKAHKITIHSFGA